MPITPPKFWTTNWLFTGAAMTPSSEAVGNPVEALEDQQRTYPWRTATGWTITDDNNKLDFNRGGVKVATIPNGYYPTGALLCVAVIVGLEAADPTPVWNCRYNVFPNLFQIESDIAFSTLWATGVNKYRSIHRSLGYPDIDYAPSVVFHSSASFQSTHTLTLALTAAQAAGATTGVAILGHNMSAAAGSPIFQLQANATNVWSAPSTVVNLMTDPTGWQGKSLRFYITPGAVAYFRLYISDVANPVGFFEMGQMWLGPTTASPVCFSDNRTDQDEDFSTINQAINGGNFVNPRGRRERLALEFADVPEASALTFRTSVWNLLSAGQNFVMDLFPAAPSPSADFLYGYLPELPTEAYVPGGLWTFGFAFLESV